MVEMYFGCSGGRSLDGGARAFDEPLRRTPYAEGTHDHELWWASLIAPLEAHDARSSAESRASMSSGKDDYKR